MDNKNVKFTREKNLCVSCEICNSICPVDAIEMEYEEGKFVPYINKDTCINCGKCFMVCPGADLELYEGKDFDNRLTGSYIEGYSAYTKNQKILKNSTSGGAISQLLVELLENDHYEGAFVLPFDMFDGEPARLELAKNKEKIKAAAKSKYLPASVYNVVERLSEESNPNYIIVGTPCQLKGIKNFIQMNKINDKNLLFLGLFCEKTLNFNVLKYFEEKFSKNDEKLIKFDYKNKEKDGWPGRPKLYFDSGRELVVDRKERIQIKDYFQLERCLYCLDKLNKQADISFGDCYISGKGNPGRSSIIIRTEKGKKVWEEYVDLFNVEKSSVKSIQKSQNISGKKENLEFIKSFKENERSSELKKRRKRIELGKKSKFDKIKSSVQKEEFKKRFGFLKGSTALELTLGMSISYLTDTLTKNIDTPKYSTPNNVVVFGGELFNKGAQAMTFTVVDQLKKRFPIENIYVLSSRDFHRDELEKETYNFEILPFDLDIGKNLLLDSQFNILDGKEEKHAEKDLKKILENADLAIDVSGYHLSSQMGSGIEWVIYSQFRYILRIVLLKKFSIPIFILPQSFGPFDYSLPHKPILHFYIRRYLKYPEKIYPREPQGKECLKNFTKDNVERKRDIVLLNEGYDIGNIFNDKKIKKIDIDKDSVGIIPNNQVMKRRKEGDIYNIYRYLIQNLLKRGKKVFLLRHSQSDLHICHTIKEMFPDNEDVILLSEDMNAIELENVLEQFDFIIGSRYHSIIHAYKNGIPALVIGWANKYEVLLEDFNQQDYIFDVRKKVDKKKLLHSLERMINNFKEEQNTIITKLNDMEKNIVFKDIEKYFS